MNQVWEAAELLTEWKESWVVPIPKPEKPSTQLENLRPIPLASNIIKLAERLVGRLQYHLESRHELDPTQTGFRSHLVPQDSLFMIYRDVFENTSLCNQRVVVAIDVKETFDSVPHEAVIRAAEQRGQPGRPLAFIKSFLQDWRYRVKVGATLGPKMPSNMGVPQGFVFSPTLFNIVIAGLPSVLKHIEGLAKRSMPTTLRFSPTEGPRIRTSITDKARCRHHLSLAHWPTAVA